MAPSAGSNSSGNLFLGELGLPLALGARRRDPRGILTPADGNNKDIQG